MSSNAAPPTSQHGQAGPFPPGAEFAAAAVAGADRYEASAEDRLAYWADQARDALSWDADFDQTLDWSEAPFAKWFVNGQLNAAYNCVDRHVEAGHGERAALLFEGEPGDARRITYSELAQEVARAANAFESLGVGKGDRVAIYMPLIPETIISMLACARIGALHSVVFGGFSADALRSRVDDAEAKLVITADGSYRRGRPTMLKPNVDEALSEPGHSVEHVLVVRRNGEELSLTPERDLWWDETVPHQSAEHTYAPHDSEHPLFILYTSGTTGRPKGILHTTGGYLAQTAVTTRDSFDLRPESDVYWCTADVGWVTGHSYLVYGPLANGATQVIYEGTPDTPHKARMWEIVAKYGVTQLYTAPTLIRTCMKWGRELPDGYDLSSLRVLGTVGEAINPEAWLWFRDVIGANNGPGQPPKKEPAPIVDTWWQTETGGHMIAPLPGVTHTKPGSAQAPVPGIDIGIVDEMGEPVGNGESGFLVIRQPWPAMLRGIWRDPERYRETYWSRFGTDLYFAGDGARYDEDGDIWLMGRVDDVMNVSGHRLSTTEIESSLVAHAKVAEAAVVGAKDATTGEAVVAFVMLSDDAAGDPEAVEAELRDHVRSDIGAIAKPRNVLVVPELPKTRSGKIMRRLLKNVANGDDVGDSSTLSDPSVMIQIAEDMRAQHAQ
ncbi:acetate--CoA ligase [Nesterenkonia sp. NBAIMH1]|uniref:acetate--CoA ligase n=1 Tax=Nesterenkonia sp. NBAIMH1 TaxID=2600320 RepID=UPI0011B41DD7|nr:acetate--CoA ligase [Nesterenkonia sp. NBAIMH1]